MKRIGESKFSRALLRAFCPDHLLEEIEGDLIQKFNRDVEKFGKRKAKRRFIWNVVRFFRPGIVLRNRFTMNFINPILIGNYFKISLRYMAKNRTFAMVNILGLALGMAAAILIFEYTYFERSFDAFHNDSENIYRVTTAWNPDQTPDDNRATTVPWSGPGIKEAFPEVVEYARFAPLSIMTGANTVHYTGKAIDENDIFLADPGFLTIFSFPLLEGDRQTVLSKPYEIIVTEQIAKKYFGNESPLGKSLFLDTHGNLGGNDYNVVGVIEAPPANSHMSFDFLISYSSMWPGLADGSTFWHWDNTYCYLLLRPDADKNLLEQKISDLRVSLFGNEFGMWNDRIEFKLQPIQDIHLHSTLRSEISYNGNGRALTFLTIVGAFILLSAYINYINLATVKSIERRTEIGIRKVVGSSKIQLIVQVLIESIVINFSALVLAVLVVAGSIPIIENIFNIQWPDFDINARSVVILFTAMTVVLTGTTLSALYPAFVITAYKPIQALKGVKSTISVAGNSWSFRKSMMVTQFVFCIVFIIGTFGLYEQLEFMKNHDLGMNTDQVIAVRTYGFQPYKVYKNFKEQMSLSPRVNSVGSSSAAPGDEIMMLGLRPKVRIGSSEELIELKMVAVDEDFFKTLEVEFLAGRNFDPSSSTESNAVILNETAAHLLGHDDAKGIINQPLHNELSNTDGEVVGVIRNYHQRSLNNFHEPIMFVPNWIPEYNLGWNKFYYFVRLNQAVPLKDVGQVVTDMESAWNASTHDLPFSYFFLDDYFEENYKSETTFSSLFLFFSGFAIFIACLGLFGLVSYTTLQRAREIGIRKILGASVRSVLILLSREFVTIILVATIVAVPLVGYGLHNWLESYAFRIGLHVHMFVYPVLLIFVLSMVTVLIKSFTVATDNPVNSLRSE